MFTYSDCFTAIYMLDNFLKNNVDFSTYACIIHDSWFIVNNYLPCSQGWCFINDSRLRTYTQFPTGPNMGPMSNQFHHIDSLIFHAATLLVLGAKYQTANGLPSISLENTANLTGLANDYMIVGDRCISTLRLTPSCTWVTLSSPSVRWTYFQQSQPINF